MYDNIELTVVRDGEVSVSTYDDVDYWTLTTRKLEGFFDAIRTDAEPPVPGEFGLRVTRLTEAAFRSVERGEPVDAGSLP